MKRSYFAILGSLILTIAGGCSNSPTPPPSTPTTPQVNYVAGSAYVYYAQNLNATTGEPIPGSGDTITSRVLTTDTVYQGKSNVTVIQNTHTNPVSVDTTYIAQDSGNYWHYNYGLESLNKNAAVLAYNHQKPIIGGWVLQAKLAATDSEKWIAADTTITIGSATPLLTDSVTELNDTTFDTLVKPNEQTATNSPISAKHSVHIVNFNAGLIQARGPVDTYVSAQYGQVLNIFHPTSVAGQAAPGQIVQLIQVQ